MPSLKQIGVIAAVAVLAVYLVKKFVPQLGL